jgi:hypothetical protein
MSRRPIFGEALRGAARFTVSPSLGRKMPSDRISEGSTVVSRSTSSAFAQPMPPCDPAWKSDPSRRGMGSKIEPSIFDLLVCRLWHEAGEWGCWLWRRSVGYRVSTYSRQVDQGGRTRPEAILQYDSQDPRSDETSFSYEPLGAAAPETRKMERATRLAVGGERRSVGARATDPDPDFSRSCGRSDTTAAMTLSAVMREAGRS